MSERFVARLLDRTDTEIAPLPTVRGGSLDWSTFRQVAGQGSLEFTRGDLDIDFIRDRIGVSWVKGSVEIPVGVYLPSVSQWDHEGSMSRATLQLSDKTEMFNSEIGEWTSLASGTPGVDAVLGMLHAVGETKITYTPSTQTTSTNFAWEPNKTRLTIMNEILASVGYGSIWVDALGYFRLEPYVAPSARPLVGTYGGDPGDLLMRKAHSSESDVYALPTGIAVYVQGNEDTAGFVGRADLPDHHPLSAEARGYERIVTRDSEAATPAIAASEAQAALDEALQVIEKVTVVHPMNQTEVNDRVGVRPLAMDGTVTQRTIQLGLGAVVTDQVRRVWGGGELPWLI